MAHPFNYFVGAHLRVRPAALRLEHHLTQVSVAKAIHVSPSTYRRFEKGSGSLKMTLFVKLANLYQVSADYLAGLSDVSDA